MQLSKVLAEIREWVGIENLTDSCSGRGCRVDMTDIPRDRIVVDIDMAFKAHQKTGKHYDRIIKMKQFCKWWLCIVDPAQMHQTFSKTHQIMFMKTRVTREEVELCILVCLYGCVF